MKKLFGKIDISFDAYIEILISQVGQKRVYNTGFSRYSEEFSPKLTLEISSIGLINSFVFLKSNSIMQS